MKIIYSWLREFVEFDWTPEELASRLTLAGLEVEGIENHSPGFSGVITGKVLHRDKHPNADKLSVCSVDLGDGLPVRIVCGAPNVQAGQMVPVAVPGSKLPGGLSIGKATIRGVESSGMICSRSELGLEEGKSPGIWVLPENTKPGLDLVTLLGLKTDYVLEVAITANRGDCLSHLGIAREVSALTGNPVRIPDTQISPDFYLKETSDPYISIELAAPAACPVYVGWYLDGVRPVASPDWMQRRLQLMGLRPRNILVDATNYVMMECGQPLHAFDYSTIQSRKIKVFETGKTRFTTLDSKERELPDRALMIGDDSRAVALAGIMGGENSEVTDSTRTVLLESAWFHPASIRRTAKRLGVSTDSSYRFERGIDTHLQEYAAKRAAKLMVEVTGGKLALKPVVATSHPPVQNELVVRFQQVKRILGIEIPKERIHSILENLGFVLIGESATQMMVRIPTHRPDITREIDVIEELIRIHGFQHIPESGTVTTFFNSETSKEHDRNNRIKFILCGAGFQEVICNSMISRPESDLITTDSVEILNPQSEDMKTLRPSMIPGLLQVIRRNQNMGVPNLRLFEFGRTFLKTESDRYKRLPGYTENRILAIALTGDFLEQNWNQPVRKSSFFDLKSVVMSVTGLWHLQQSLQAEPQADSVYSNGMVLLANGKRVASLGELRPELTGFYDCRNPVYVAEIYLDLLDDLSRLTPRYRELPRFLPVEKDLAFWVDKTVPADKLIATIRESERDWIQDVRVFDVFEAKGENSGRRSVAFRITLQNLDRTFTDEDINAWIQKVKKGMETAHQAELRGV
ncbi:MAG: phenylalanine--tRNA ligase subunit beta [Bacteroidetes bacterium]|nr:phenylalanine--tRNA ligase subunit beta [Bacteroidota bacterium]